MLLAVVPLAVALYAVEDGEDTSLQGVNAGRYTLAIERFEVGANGNKTNEVAMEAIGTLLPELIIERLSRSMKRDVTAQEYLEDKLWPLRQERLELFMRLDNAVKERDSVVLLDISAASRRRRLKAAQKTIKEAAKALEDNLAKTDSTITQENKIAAKEEEARKAVKGDNTEGNASKARRSRMPLEVNIYSREDTMLWDAGVEKSYDTDDKHTSVKYARAAVLSGVNTLITGKLSVQDEYVWCSIGVYLYPLAQEAGRVSDVGNITNLSGFAQRLTEAIIPIITNTMPCRLSFAITGADMGGVSICIDDMVYKGVEAASGEGAAIGAGLHTVSFTAKGYHPVSATYSFEGGREYNVEAQMQEVQDESIALEFTQFNKISYDKKNYFDSERVILSNAQLMEWQDSGKTQSVIKINGKAILGIVLTDGATPAQFYVPLSLIEDKAALEVKTQVFDRAAYIDKRRRWFYTSYSVLMTSLIGSFYTAGRYNAMNGYEDQGTMDRWQTARVVTASVSVACGAWAIYELVRYLRAASKVLPDEASQAHRQ